MLKYANLYEMVSKNALSTPDKNAIFYYESIYTYKMVEEKVEQIASVLANNGIGKKSKVGVLLSNSPEYLFTFFAIVKLGAVSVPQNIFLKAVEITDNFNDCGIEFFISSSMFSEVVKNVLPEVPTIKKVFSYEDTDFDSLNIYQAKPTAKAPQVNVGHDDLAMLIYTSGTTAKSKGVMLSHKNLMTNGHQYEILVETNVSDYTVAVLPLFHAYAFLACVIGPFYASGGTVIFNSIQDTAKAEFMQYIIKYKPSLMIGVPQLYSAFARKKLTPQEQAMMPFRLYVSGGAPLPADTIESFHDSYGHYIIEGYGLSEASPVAAFNPTKKPKTGSIGKVAPYMSYKVVDSDGKEVERGEPGELIIKGDNVMQGYWGKPEETALVLDKDGWLKTGDVVTEDEENYLRIVDRLKDLIISKGLNIYPREIEELLYRHPAVAHAAVIGVPDKDGSEIVVAYIELQPEKTATDKEIKEYLKPMLANYKLPKSVVFVEHLPVNASGKVMKRELRQKAMENRA